MGNVEISERLRALVLRRQSRVYDIKYRGELRPSRWFVYEANQKQHWFKGFKRWLRDV